MFANTFQSGFISIFYSVGSNPLSLWDKQVKNGHIRRVVDDEAKSLVLELSGTNVATTYITCPIKPRASLGIKLPFLVMVIKNMKKYFTFEIQILDDKNMHRRFRVSNFQSTTKVRPFCTTMPIGLSGGWNQIQFNLADFTRRAYGTVYRETMRVQIHANVRIRRIYFADRLYADHEMPTEFKLLLPGTTKTKDTKRSSKEEAEKKPAVPAAAEVTPAPPPTTAEPPKEDEDKIQAEEVELPMGAPPTPIESIVDAEEKAPEVAEEIPVIEEVASEPRATTVMEETSEPATPVEVDEEAVTETPAEVAENEEALPEAVTVEDGEAAQVETAEVAADEQVESYEAEKSPPTETPEIETPVESPTTAGETTGDESPNEAEAAVVETAEAAAEE